MIWIEVSLAQLSRARRATAAQVREFASAAGYDNDVVVDDPCTRYSSPCAHRAERHGRSCAPRYSRQRQRALQRSISAARRAARYRRQSAHRHRAHLPAHTRGVPCRCAGACGGATGTQRAHAVGGAGRRNFGGRGALQWLSETSEPRPSDYLLLLSLLCGAVLVWTGGWATLSRVFSGQAGFERNLLIALWGALLLELGAEAAGIAAFALSWSGALATYSYAGAWTLLAVICFLHMREMSGSRLRFEGWYHCGARGRRHRHADTAAIGEAYRHPQRRSDKRGTPPPASRVATGPSAERGRLLRGRRSAEDRDSTMIARSSPRRLDGGRPRRRPACERADGCRAAVRVSARLSADAASRAGVIRSRPFPRAAGDALPPRHAPSRGRSRNDVRAWSATALQACASAAGW